MKSIYVILALCSASAFATPFPVPTHVDCDIAMQIDGGAQTNQALVMQVGNVVSCDSQVERVNISGSPLQLGVAFLAACQEPSNSYPEHLPGINITGPAGSSIYASAFSAGYSAQQALQHRSN